jgi:hypothetical protein
MSDGSTTSLAGAADMTRAARVYIAFCDVGVPGVRLTSENVVSEAGTSDMNTRVGIIALPGGFVARVIATSSGVYRDPIGRGESRTE